MDGIQSVKLNLQELALWCHEAERYIFTRPNSVFISSLVLSQGTLFGITSDKNIFILLNAGIYETPFKIHNLIELTGPSSFLSASDGKKVHGSGLIIKTKSVASKIRFLRLIDKIMSSNDFKSDLDGFFELLRKASLKQKRLQAPSLYAEMIILKSLFFINPDIVALWRASGNSIIDISASDKNPAIEVKSTTNVDSRRHVLSMHQIRYFLDNENSLIASVQVHEDSGGTSCKDLCEDLIMMSKDEFLGSYQILYSYLIAYEDEQDFASVRFNEKQTASSILYIRPILGELGMGIKQPPPWLNSASFEIDFSIIPKSEVDIFNQS